MLPDRDLTRILEESYFSAEKSPKLEEKLETNRKKQEELNAKKEEAEQAIRTYPYHVAFVPAALTTMTVALVKTIETAYQFLNDKTPSMNILPYQTFCGLAMGATYAVLISYYRLHAKVQLNNYTESIKEYIKEEKQIKQNLDEFR